MMKKFNIFGVHWNFRGEGLMKNQYGGGNCLKKGPGQFADLGGDGFWQERGGGGGVDTLMHTMSWVSLTLC